MVNAVTLSTSPAPRLPPCPTAWDSSVAKSVREEDRECLSCGEAAHGVRSTDVSAVWSDGGRLSWVLLVKILPAVVLSAAVGDPEEADHPRILRVLIGGG